MSTPLLDSYHFMLAGHSLGHHASHGRESSGSTTMAANLCRALEVPPFGNNDGLPEKAADALMKDLQLLKYPRPKGTGI